MSDSAQSDAGKRLAAAIRRTTKAMEAFAQAWHEHARRHPFPHVDDKPGNR